jgi:hypothetical protein
VYFPHRLTVLHDPGQFAMSLSAARLGPISVGLLGYSGEVRLETAELSTGYEVNVPLTGPLRTWTGQAEVCAAPAMAAVYRPDGRTLLQGWAGGGRLFGLKIERSALEAELAELAGVPVGSMTDPHRQDPHLFYRAARARPVAFSPSIGAYMVSRYTDLRAVIDDPGTFSSSAALPMIYDNPPEVAAELTAEGCSASAPGRPSWAGRSCRRALCCCCCSVPATATRRCSPIPTPPTWTGRTCGSISRSAPGCTCARALR